MELLTRPCANVESLLELVLLKGRTIELPIKGECQHVVTKGEQNTRVSSWFLEDMTR